MKHVWLLGVVLGLAAFSGACRKDNRAEQLAALDSAYQSGVITRAEYDAKRQALAGSAVQPAPAPVAPAASIPSPPVAAAPIPEVPASEPAPTPSVPSGRQPGAQSAPARSPAAHRTAEAKPVPKVSESGPGTVQQQPPTPPEPPRPAGALPATPPPAAAAQPAIGPTPQPPSSGAAAEEEPHPLAGCDDAEFRSGKVKGAKQRFYPASPEEVKKAAREALARLDFNLHKDAGNEMEASKRRHIGVVVGAGGERLLLHFEKSHEGNQAGTMVTGETRKSLVGRLAQKSWTNAILAQIACHLRATR